MASIIFFNLTISKKNQKNLIIPKYATIHHFLSTKSYGILRAQKNGKQNRKHLGNTTELYLAPSSPSYS